MAAIMIPAGAASADGGNSGRGGDDRIRFDVRNDRIRIEARDNGFLPLTLNDRLMVRDLIVRDPFLFRQNILPNDLLTLRDLRVRDFLANPQLRVRTLNPLLFPDRVRVEVRADDDLRFNNLLGGRVIIR